MLVPFYTPNKIYKFMQSCWAEKFLSGESILIGTLDDFRNLEKHKLNKADAMEGSLSIIQHGVWNTNDSDKKDLKIMLQNTGLKLEGVTMLSGSGSAIKMISDAFVFCASAEFNPHIADDLDPTYDVCIEINDVRSFAVELARSLCYFFQVNRLKFDGALVEYKSREVASTANTFEYNGKIKDAHFKNQNEYRLLFEDKNAYRKPIALKVDMSRAAANICWRRG